MYKMRTRFVFLAILATFLGFPIAVYANDVCKDSAAQVPQLLVNGLADGIEVVGLGESRSTTFLRHESGDAVLLSWAYGAGGRLQCSYVAYRHNGEPYRYFAVPSRYIQVLDIDGDGFDEVISQETLPWGMECSSAMATMPTRFRIDHLDMASGTLVDVTRIYSRHVRTFLIDLKKNYDEVVHSAGGEFTPECQEEWVRLLKETYESAWFVLLVAACAISVMSFAMGFARSTHWRWIGRFVGAIAVVATTAAAFYSLGETGWHIIGFSDFWSSFQVVTGYRFHSNILELLSALFTLYAGCRLVAS